MITSAQPATAAAQAPAPFTLRVTTKDALTVVTLQADDVPLTAIAAELGKRLRANVTVGPSLREERISVGFADSPLEVVLSPLASRVLIDYELRQNREPVPREIRLLGPTDPEPALNSAERGISTGLFITGNTEDVASAPAEDPLLITGDRKLLSMTVKQQPLSDAVRAVGDVLGVQVDLRYDATELVDLDVREAAPEDILPRLSPNLRLIVRVDVNRAERTLARLVVDNAPER